MPNRHCSADNTDYADKRETARLAGLKRAFHEDAAVSESANSDRPLSRPSDSSEEGAFTRLLYDMITTVVMEVFGGAYDRFGLAAKAYRDLESIDLRGLDWSDRIREVATLVQKYNELLPRQLATEAKKWAHYIVRLTGLLEDIQEFTSDLSIENLDKSTEDGFKELVGAH